MSAEREPVRPVSPEELAGLQVEQIPPEVIEVFNELLTERVVEGRGSFTQEEAEKRLVARGLELALIYKRGWMNIEGIYREAGWKVEYDKPGYNEFYKAHFIFRAPRKS